jgi:hypothetical protein
MPNITIHPTRAKIMLCQQEILRADDDERSKDLKRRLMGLSREHIDCQ